jgi:spore coat protein H
MTMNRRTTAAALVVLGCAFALRGLAAQDRDDSHGRNATPDYARVFAQDRVGRFDIRVEASDWQIVLADMASMAGPRGQSGQPGGGGVVVPPGGGQQPGIPVFNPGAIAACAGALEGNVCTIGTPPVSGRCIQTGNGGGLACVQIVIANPGAGNPGAGNPGAGNPGAGNPGVVGAGQRDDVEIFPRTPIYVPADVTFDGEVFRHVGFRLKGNSTLANTWRSGSDKVPFRLNIDGLEARFPEIADQTLFGFPNLSFGNNASDSSYLRNKVATDLFRDAGLPAARTAFVRVFLDRGGGPLYLGLYTMSEVPDTPMLDDVFGSNDGNLYKPNGAGGRWTTFLQGSFPKRTNAEQEDWTDIEGAIGALNAAKTDRAGWRQRLEARLDVPSFLRWLALNTMIGNFDAYGGLSAHNYYLYGSPRHRDRLFWIPWDHDLSLSAGGIGGGGPGGTATGALDLFHNNITAIWPLIRFLMDDPVYRAAYRGHVENLLSTVFEPGSVSARLRTEQARIAPYVIGSEGEQPGRTFAGTPAQFDATVFGPNGLIAYVQSRAAAVRTALSAAP